MNISAATATKESIEAALDAAFRTVISRPVERKPAGPERVVKDADLRRLAAKGMRAVEIAEELGCRAETVWKRGANIGLKFAKKKTRITGAKIRKMLSNGYGVEDVSVKLCVPESRVRSCLEKTI